MKLTVLGCWGAYPAKGEATAGYLLQTDKHNILLDCGSGVLAQLPYFLPIEELDAVFITHYHFDHIADLGCLQYAIMLAQRLGRRSKPLPIYGQGQTGQLALLSKKNSTLGREVKVSEDIDLEGLKVSFLNTLHDSYNLALKFAYQDKTLIYTGDTGYMETLIPFASKCNFLLAEASLYEDRQGLYKWHMTASETGCLADQAEAEKLVLTHFPHYGELCNLFLQARRTYQGVLEMAACGKVFLI